VTGRDRGNPTSCGAELPFRSQAGRDATSQTEWARSRCAARGLDSCADRRGYGLDPRSYRADRPKQQRPADEGEALMIGAGEVWCPRAERTMVYRPSHCDDVRGVYPLGRPSDNAPRGQRGLARLPTARSDARNKGRAAVDRAPCEERGETKATEDRSLDTLRDARYDRCEGSARERATAPHKETTNNGTAP
jgi:hypothetical protein